MLNELGCFRRLIIWLSLKYDMLSLESRLLALIQLGSLWSNSTVVETQDKLLTVPVPLICIEILGGWGSGILTFYDVVGPINW